MKKSTSFVKKILKVIIWVSLGILLLFAIVAGLIQIPAVQNKIINSVTSYISSKTNTRIEIANIRISFPKSAVIKSLYLEDLQNDTLLYAGKIKANIAFRALLSHKIHINSFVLENTVLNANRTVADSLFNFNFLIHAFSDSGQQKKVNPKPETTWTFKADRLNLKNIRLHYDDKYGGNTFGIALGNLELKMDVIDFKKSIYSVDEILVENLNAEVVIKNQVNKKKKTSDRSLPIITANKLWINNSTFSYVNPDSKQSVITAINKLNLKDGSVDLQKETVKVNAIYLSESEISYFAKSPDLPTFSADKEPRETTKSNWIVDAKSIELDNNSFAYEVPGVPEIKNAFDSNHLKYRHISLKARDLHYSSEKTEAVIGKFTAVDHNNFAVTKFETVFSMNPHSVTAKKIKVKTKDSSIDADISLEYSALKSLRDSLEFLIMNLEMDDISVKNSDILYFAPQLKNQIFFRDKSNITTISGSVNGQLNSLKGENLIVKTGLNTIIKTDFFMSGLPDSKIAYFSFPALTLNSGKQDIEMIVGPSIPKSIKLPEKIGLLVAFKGTIKDFESTVTMNSSFGKAQVFASIDKNEDFQSKVTITNFNLGSLLDNNEMFGPVSLTAEANGHGLDKNEVEAEVKVEVSQVFLNNYTYHNLTANGIINGLEFDGNINLNDKYAVFDFEGLVNLNPNHEAFVFQLNIPGANLQKLNFTKDDIRIGLNARTDLQADSINSINGRGGISNLVIALGDKKYMLDSLLFVSLNEPNRSDLTFNSALFEVKYSGTISPADLSSELKHFINNYFPFADSAQLQSKNDSADFNFEIRLHNHPIISQVLLPQLKEFEPGVIKGSYNGLKKDLKLNVGINKIVYGTTEIKDFIVDVKSDSTALNYKISSSKISNSQINFDNFLLDGKIEDKTIFANVSSIADNKDKKFLIRSQLTRENANYRFALDPKEFYLMNNSWTVPADNYIEFGKDGFLIHNFFINNGISEINIGSVNDNFNDDINIAIKNFKLDDLSGIIEKDTSLAKGNIDGNVLLKRVNNTYGIIADAVISDLIIREIPVGNISLKAYNPTAGKFDVELNVSGSENNITASGFFLPDSGHNSINMNVNILSLSLKTIEAFSMGQISETAGALSGILNLQGNLKAPEITGELVFNDVFVKPAALNSRLELKHETIQLRKEGIYFKSFTLSDEDKNTVIINGSVQMKQFKDFVFDLSVNSSDFLLFNTTTKDNKSFFGRMIIDSKVTVNGPMALPVVNGRLIMKKGSNFTFAVPESRLTTDKGENVVEFEDSLLQNSILYGDEKEVAKKSGFKGFDLSAIIEIDKQVSLRLLMDPSSSDSLVVRGEAALSFGIDRSGKMSLTGSYNLDEGSYLVSLESVIKRKFDIMPGSTITWNGDPLDAEVSINAKYTVRAAPYDLVTVQVSDLSEADKEGSKRQYPFWVILKLRGEILHPVISFEIQLPPEEKGILGGLVNQKLNMLNEDASALNKQVFALLVLGRFVQENPLQTESGGTASIVRSTVGSFLSAQLNKLSSNLMPGSEINFDIQSYNEFQTGEAKGRTQVEVGIKKQLFNERLSVQVGGTVDVEGEKAKQNSASDITGDVTVEYKLTEDGRFRMKAFRHNQYEGAIEGQLVETGAGIVYVKDFNKWNTFFKPKENEGGLFKKRTE